MTPPAGDHYDLIVLGAGSGGYVAAIRAAQLGMSVGIVEERYWGGVCLNTGCVPSKALLRNAEIASIITDQSANFGISGDVSLDYSRAVSRSREVSEARVRGVHFLMRKNNITEIDGHGRFTDPHNLHIDLREGGSRLLSFDHAVIATGSRVRMLPGVTLSDNIVTYEQQILSADLPESIVIIGGGAIGMEFAYILHSYGVRVEILEFADRVLPNEDPDVSRELQRHYRRRGMAIHTSTRVDKVIDHGEHVVVSHTGADGTSATAQAARAFICIGFCPNVEQIGLDAAGVRVTADRGYRHRRLHAYVRAAYLCNRRRHRQSSTRPRRFRTRRGSCRNHCRRGNDAVGLPDDAASDVLPATGRQLRLHRRTGARRRSPLAGRYFSHAGQRQSPRTR